VGQSDLGPQLVSLTNGISFRPTDLVGCTNETRHAYSPPYGNIVAMDGMAFSDGA